MRHEGRENGAPGLVLSPFRSPQRGPCGIVRQFLRSTLAIWPPGRRHRSRVLYGYSLDFLRLGAHSQPAKSLLTSWECPPHTRSGVRVPEGRVDQGGAKRSLRKVLSGRRELRGALRDRRIEVSPSGGWSRGVPYPFR